MPLSLTVAVIPRHNLKLPQYIAELSAALEAAGVEVTRAGLLYDVRVDGTPVGRVAFTLPPSDGQTPLAGYQLTQLDEGREFGGHDLDWRSRSHRRPVARSSRNSRVDPLRATFQVTTTPGNHPQQGPPHRQRPGSVVLPHAGPATLEHFCMLRARHNMAAVAEPVRDDRPAR